MSSSTANQPLVSSACNQTGTDADASLNVGDLVRCSIAASAKDFFTGVITKTISPDVEVQLDSSGEITVVRSLNCDRISFVHAMPLRGITQGSVVKHKFSGGPDSKTGYVKWIGTLHVEGTAQRVFHFAALEGKIQVDKSEPECIPPWAHLSFQKHVLTRLELPSTLELYLVERLEIIVLHQPDIRQSTTKVLEGLGVEISYENKTHYGKVMWIGTFMDTGRNIAILELDEEIADCTDHFLSITSSRRNLLQVDLDAVRLHKEMLPFEENPVMQDMSSVDRKCSRLTGPHSTSLNTQLPNSNMTVGSIITIHAGPLSTHATVQWTGEIRHTDIGQVALVNTERSADLMAKVDEIRSFTQEHLDALRNTLHLDPSDMQIIVPLEMCVVKDAALQTGDVSAYRSVNSTPSNNAVNNESTGPDQVLPWPKSQTSTSDQGYADPSLSAASSMKNILQVDPNEVGPQKRVPSEPPANSTTASNDKSTESNGQHPRPAPRSSKNSQAESHTSTVNIEDLANDIAKLKTENQQLTDANRSREQDAERLERSNQQMDKAFNQKQTELSACEYKCREQKTQIETLNQDVERLEQSLQLKDQELNQKTEELNDSEEERRKQKREIENLKQKVEQLEWSLQQKEQALNKNKKDLSDREKDSGRQKQEIEYLKKELGKCERNLKEKDRALNEKTEAQNMLMVEHQKLKQENQQLEQNCRNVVEDYTNLTRMVKTLQFKHDKMEATVVSMLQESTKEFRKVCETIPELKLVDKQVIKVGSHQKQNASAAKLIPATPSNSDIGIGSMVLYDGKSGRMAWIGRDSASDQSNQLLAAVELDGMPGIEFPDECTHGDYKGSKPFHSEERNVIYCLLDDCRLNPKFLIKRNDALQGQLIPAQYRTVEGHVPASPSNPRTGLCKGVQGNQNSCYMDVTLFAMFAYSSVFDEYFKSEVIAHNHQQAPIIRVLRENIVNPLRRYGCVAADSVHQFRQLLDQIGKVKGLMNLEKDPEEFINLLLSDILTCPPLVQLSTGHSCNMFDLIGDKMNGVEFPSVQMLLENAFKAQQIWFQEAPQCLILHMPRSGKDCKVYPKIFPNSELDITGLVFEYKQRCHVCNSEANIECLECRKTSKHFFLCHKCSEHVHKNRPEHYRKDRRLNGQIHGQCKLQLSSVLCIETSHYVSFTRTGAESAPWVFFDSMSDRQDEINVPAVTHVEDLELKLLTYEEVQQQYEETPLLMKRLFKDVYICFYHLTSAETKL